MSRGERTARIVAAPSGASATACGLVVASTRCSSEPSSRSWSPWRRNSNERTYAVVDELEVIAPAHESSPARVALAWVREQPGVTSTIIGARRAEQLEDNVGSLDVVLTPEERARLDALTKPTFGFPQNMQPIFPAIHNGGTTVNGVYAPPSPFGLMKGDRPY